jgi:hypothetical protein
MLTNTMKTICKVDKLKCECGANQSLHLTTLFYNYANPGRFYCGYRAHVGMDVRIQDLAFSHNVNKYPSDWDYQM